VKGREEGASIRKATAYGILRPGCGLPVRLMSVDGFDCRCFETKSAKEKDVIAAALLRF
jgi:hypothetical protein